MPLLPLLLGLPCDLPDWRLGYRDLQLNIDRLPRLPLLQSVPVVRQRRCVGFYHALRDVARDALSGLDRHVRVS